MLYAIIKKELRLVTRDVHALMVLFLMPLVFILIMSLALQDRMGSDSEDNPRVGLLLASAADQDEALISEFTNLQGLQVELAATEEELLNKLDKGEILAAILIPQNFTESIQTPVSEDENKLQILYADTLPASLRRSILGTVRESLGEYQVAALFQQDELSEEERQMRIDHLLGRSLVLSRSRNPGSGKAEQPNSVQQSVPSWLIFSMFFVVIPISTTLLTEKQQGTLQRLQTLPVPTSYLLIGKLIPYLGINLIQVVLMLLVGTHLLPLISGEGLVLEGEIWLLLPLTLAISLCAISFALLIATRAKSMEQATTFGGISNLILAAIGGIMVPTFVMPELMQAIAGLSPMNWALEGFFSILLRQGGWGMVAPEIGKLVLLAVALFALSIFYYKRLTDRGR
jgi:ABC-2 type transport system permease protein